MNSRMRRYSVLLLTLAATPALGLAAFCGQPGQRACEPHEQFMRCAPGLVFNFARQQCERPARPVLPSKALQRDCGGYGEPACNTREHFPPCGNGLVEDAATGKCVVPGPAPATDPDR